MDKKTLAQRFGNAGLIPFCVSALLVWVTPETFGYRVSLVFLSYSGIILSFLAGMLWIVALLKENELSSARGLLTWSIMLSLLGWLGILVSGAMGAALLLIGFIGLRRVEINKMDQYYPEWFVELRNFLTQIVVASHVAVLVFLIQL